MVKTAGAVPAGGAAGHAAAPPGTMVARLLPWIALGAAAASTVALAVVLRRAFGPQWPSRPTHWSMRVQQDERVIAAGHDEEILRLVAHGADADIPAAERPSIAGIQVDGGTIAVTFEGHPDWRLTIRAPEAPGDAFLRTAAFAATWSAPTVPDTIRHYVSVIAAAPAWAALWTPPGRDYPRRPDDTLPHPAPARSGEHPLIKESGSPQARASERSVWLIVLCTLVTGTAAAALLLVAGTWRRAPPRGAPRRAELAAARAASLAPLAVSTAAMALGVAVLAVAHFHFRADDYSFLALATHYPSEMSGETRLLSTRAHYQLGVLLGGGAGWFAASNLLLLGAMCALWAVLLRRLRSAPEPTERRPAFSRHAAVTAAALLALGPGTFFLLRQANGIEHLSATTCLMVVLLLTDLAAREADRPAAWRYGVLMLALCLSLLGVLMKLPLMIVLPPSCWLWGRWLVDRPAAPMQRSLTYAAFVAVVGGGIFALTRSNPPLGFSPSWRALAAVGERLARYSVAALLLLALNAAWRAVRSGSARQGTVELLAPVVDLWRLRIGTLPALAWALALSGLWFLPFALHAEYEGDAHYGMLAAAPLSALAAWLISRAAEQRWASGWQGWAVACLVCLILLPVRDIRSELARSETEFVPAWLDGVRVLAATRSRPERIVVAPACPPSTFLAPLSRQMTDVYSESGIWWATGWYEVPVDFRDDEPDASGDAAKTVTLGYCPGRPATIR